MGMVPYCAILPDGCGGNLYCGGVMPYDMTLWVPPTFCTTGTLKWVQGCYATTPPNLTPWWQGENTGPCGTFVDFKYGGDGGGVSEFAACCQ